jgi:Gpi18-like mannosyltransferase
MVNNQITHAQLIGKNKFLYPLLVWLFSRLVIATAMLLIAPLLPAPPEGIVPSFGWNVFFAWDSVWYEKIATFGYEYINDGLHHSVAFFPLFPLLIRVVMSLGLPFVVAGTLVNNLAFLGALSLIYNWVENSYGRGSARWTTMVLAWFPLSLYGSVIYSEGLYLLLSAAALRAFEQKKYWWVILWGSLTTATRPTGISLIPALLFVSWQEHRTKLAYVASLATGLGLAFYSLYCQIYFHDALAFIHVQKSWQPLQEFYGQRWLKMVMQIAIGTRNWKHGAIVDIWHPLLFVIICASCYLIGRSRFRLGAAKTSYAIGFLGFVLWLIVGSPLINIAIIFGGAYLLWYFRSQLSLVVVAYGFCSLAIIFTTGRTESAERYAYGIVSIAIAFGNLLSRYPRYGYIVITFFSLLLAIYSMRFSQRIWVA